MSDVTQLLSRIESGDQLAASELLPVVYEELRRLASVHMASERADHTLQSTALVHEAYLRLVDGNHDVSWDSRAHFFSAAAEAMRRILIDRARSRQSLKHGGGRHRVELDDADLPIQETAVDILALGEALDELAAESPEKAELVKLRYFAGLTVEEAGKALGVSKPTAVRKWRHARAWLAGKLSDGEPEKGRA